MWLVVRLLTLSMDFLINNVEISERASQKKFKVIQNCYKMVREKNVYWPIHFSKCFHGGPKLNFRQCQSKKRWVYIVF